MNEGPRTSKSDRPGHPAIGTLQKTYFFSTPFGRPQQTTGIFKLPARGLRAANFRPSRSPLYKRRIFSTWRAPDPAERPLVHGQAGGSHAH